MSTDRLYYTDCYLTAFGAAVIDSADNGRRVYLDRTAFYPASGGQPHDLGILGGQRVLDVIDEGERVAHLTDDAVAPGPTHGEIDWSRRYDHMQQHTGQHLLSAVIGEEFGFKTVSFHMGSEVSSIELATKDLNEAQIDTAERRANELVREGRPLSISFEEAALADGLRKPSQRAGALRVIEIAGLDRSACGGTHVRSAAEAGPIQIRKTEKLRGNVRLEFVCGIRALARAKQDFRIGQELGRQHGVALERLPDHLAALRERLSWAEKEAQRLAADLAQRDGRELYAITKPAADGVRRVRVRVREIDEAARAQALAFTGNAGAAVILVLAENPRGVLIACSPETGLNAGAILKQVLAAAGGRGGGASNLAQGSLPNDAAGDAIAAVLGF